MMKCVKCSKIVTKKSPGLQCNKCNKWLHASCAGISAEQLSALRSTDSVDWKCRSCSGSARPKRLSCILPETEEDEYDAEALSNTVTAQILAEIRREVRETIRIEIQTSMQFYSDKIDDYEQKLKSYDARFKTLENQCSDLRNQLKNQQLRNEAMEQRMAAMEQVNLANCLEICGIEEQENENVEDISSKLCQAWKLNPSDIVKVYRKKKNNAKKNSKTTHPPAIFVRLREGSQNNWLLASKENQKTSKDIGGNDDSKIYLRESLSPYTAHLLWRAKTTLQATELFKYVWCKNGHVLVRKAEKEKIHYIHTEGDIKKLENMSRNETI